MRATLAAGMKSLLRLAPFAMLLLAVAVAAALLVNWRSLPSPRPRDDLGPIPRFIWIKPGQRRPIPSITQVAVASGLSLTSPRDATGQTAPRGCYRQLDPQGCLERNWRDFLSRFGAVELRAGARERAYRFLKLPSRAVGLTWTMATLHVRPNGAGLLEITTRPSTLLSHAWSARALPIAVADVAAFERDIRWSAFTVVEADPRSLTAQKSCSDRSNFVFEMVVKSRYRYVSRRSCQADAERVKAWGARLLQLAG